MKKKYVCRLSGLTILIKVHGKVKRVEFNRAVITPTGKVGCAYTTEDKEEQSAIENSKYFRSGMSDGIWLHGEQFVKPAPVVVEPQPELVKETPKRTKKAKKEE